MKSLLINTNPVVSRLLELCAREESVSLDEVSSVTQMQEKGYDILFVDIDSYSAGVSGLLGDTSIAKKVLIHSGEHNLEGFNAYIEKPFLPSEIIKIIHTLKEDLSNTHLENDESTLPTVLNSENDSEFVLDTAEVEKIKSLLEMDEEAEEQPDEVLSDEEYEARKMKVIKDQLVAEGLEIVGEDEIVDALSKKSVPKDTQEADILLVDVDAEETKESDEISLEEIVLEATKDEKKEKQTKTNKKKNKKKKKKKKKITFSEEELERVEDAVEVAIATLKRKKMQKLLNGKKIDITVKLEDS